MHKTIISDTSCLILLSKISELDLLHRTYGQIFTTPEVANEYQLELPNWITLQSPQNKSKQKELEQLVDKGEASAIALALETPDCLLIIDDMKGRKTASELGIEITGTIGIIIKAKEKAIIPFVKPILDKISSSTNFRLSEEIITEALRQAGEL